MQQPDAFPTALWRRPAKSAPHAPLVVFLHGRGADEYDLFSLADRLPKRCLYASLRGPVALPEGGYTWFDSRGPGRPVGASVRTSATALRAWLDDTSAREKRARTYLLGFSAGMMMAGALVLDDPQRFAGVILLSGVLPLEAGLNAAAGRLAGLPVFYARGAFDTALPAPLVAQTHAYLTERSAADLSFHEYAHAHAISPREVDDIAGWLDERA